MPFLSYQQSVVDAGMSVMGHIGLTPQSSGQLGGFKAQGLTAESAMELIEDALAIEKAGAFAVLLEAVSPEVGKIIAKKCQVPVLGIGGGIYVDGQLLIVSDMLGMFQAFTPKFVKKYTNLSEIIEKVFGDYIEEIRTEKFPQEKHCYRMREGEPEKLKALLEKSRV
jgi:3-methyl-2-oxobutanoate hydroxymethyltransferase